MRRKRVIMEGGRAVYHVTSRVFGRMFLLDARWKDEFVSSLRAVETFTGCEVFTFCAMTDHFHILVRVPPPAEVDGAELALRAEALYGPAKCGCLLRKWGRWEKAGRQDEAEAEKAALRARMYDLGEFMKTLKQRMTQRYNREKRQPGSIWDGRFRSVLVESADGTYTASTVAAYIDLNPVRAGLAAEPAGYRWCGCGRACAGGGRCRRGIASALASAPGGKPRGWGDALARYTALLREKGRPPRAGFTQEELRGLLKGGRKLTRGEALLCKVRDFTEGKAVGCGDFLLSAIAAHPECFGPRSRRPVPMGGADWGNLCSLRCGTAESLLATSRVTA